ncbi:polysaccharide chain length determinant protein, PEP-CTERM locus subfamily [Lutimaribacter pacificus]|uniref:Polysaccharide chain length determinant protein, PEP-CTERM locus subfamily n=1 Tax=Lutimaribacter pacificus TaxID=391948 RepID=A0A1H0CN06_9RHOB|nr:lipopolysaccharide biosynthesis protein [Lutimaribacter pacificus]SDN59213.1 polysaccharide chain length determinant protein, PEP-CTERM locus subfamily [Lutimaribacter pacificus]SHJ42794.1 polysaccharide chain length determinant protein, PEP-CTERM locus subfamily [Lutimaribacter pacificus]
MLPDIKFLLLLFLRRLHYFVVIALAVAAFGVTIAYTLPAGYTARATLLVESPQIPDDLAGTTVRAGTNEVLQIIAQRIQTRANLLDIAREFNVYAGRPDMSADEIVADMRGRIGIDLPRRRDAASFVYVSFSAQSGQLAAQVANEVVTRILNENRRLRTSVAGQTLEFFKQEVARLDEDLAEQGGRILAFKQANQGALPDSLDFRRARQASLQERVLQMERELAGLRDRRARLTDLYERTGEVSFDEEKLTPEEQRLQDLRNELASALVLYSPQNPRVRALQGQIEVAERIVQEQRAKRTGVSEAMSAYEIQLADLDAQMEFIVVEKTQLEKELEALEASIDKTPENAIVLSTLERDYENLRVQYQQATTDLAAARTGDQIEAQSRGQRITVVEQATPPRVPTSPPRKKIAAAGVAGGIALGGAFIFLLELLNRSVRRPVDLSNRLGIAPFVSVPYIRTHRERVVRRSIIIGAIVVVTLGIPTVLYLVDQYYLPLDLLIERAMDKTGLGALIEQLRNAF